LLLGMKMVAREIERVAVVDVKILITHKLMLKMTKRLKMWISSLNKKRKMKILMSSKKKKPKRKP